MFKWHEAAGVRKTQEARPMVKALKRPLLLCAGWLCVGLGAVGIIMPLFPTTPFLLVAVWAFSKSSPELAERIRNHRVAGPYVRAWQDEGAIPLGAKIAAIAMMVGTMTYLAFYAAAPQWAIVAAGLVMLGAAIFILTRPSSRRGQ
jgi:uncharacterized protein